MAVNVTTDVATVVDNQITLSGWNIYQTLLYQSIVNYVNWDLRSTDGGLIYMMGDLNCRLRCRRYE